MDQCVGLWLLHSMHSLPAQTAWESGGDSPFSACDENNYRGSEWSVPPPCTQRDDLQRYDSLTGPPACGVDKAMQMTAETWASWTPGPMSCVPSTNSAGCCWWGRGAIQTTGPHNYKMLQTKVIDGIAQFADIDLCLNPEAMCQHPDLRWIGAMYYWTSVVQVRVYLDNCRGGDGGGR